MRIMTYFRRNWVILVRHANMIFEQNKKNHITQKSNVNKNKIKKADYFETIDDIYIKKKLMHAIIFADLK